MFRFFSRPSVLLGTLLFCTILPITISIARLVQLPTGTLPPDGLRIAAAPLSLFLHALSGASFGILGPVQFSRSLRRKFGIWHKRLGWVYCVAGLGLGLSGLSILVNIQSISSAPLDTFRGIAGAALCYALISAIAAARARDIQEHRAWMIRAYAIGMGSGTIAFVYLPIFLITQAPPSGGLYDLVFIVWWSLNVVFAEWVVRRTTPARRMITQ